MKIMLVLLTLVLGACASPSPNVSTDNIKDGTVVCATVMGPWGSGKTVVAKIDQGVIKDGGAVQVDANCVMSVQFIPPAPKATPVKP